MSHANTRINARIFAAFTFLMCLCLMTGTLAAQSTTTGAIVGIVADSNGAVVPGAKIEVRNLGTNSSQSIVANEEGLYRAVNLTPGSYEVSIAAANFSKYKATC